MNTKCELRTGWPRWTLALAALGLTTLPSTAWQAASNLTVRAEAMVKQGYDSNVYLQDQQPDLTKVPRAVQPFTSSFFTTLTPGIFLDYKPCAAFNLAASYAPAISFYYSTPSENNIANRVLANLGGTISEVPWEIGNAVTVITGQDEGLFFGGPPLAPTTITGGNAPALGGIPARDRRDATVYRGLYRATWTSGKFFVRPVSTAYVHNFQTIQKDSRAGMPDYGYENYVDRSEFAGGLDAGYEVAKNLRVFLGYRYGVEDQGSMVGSPYQYDTTYNRPGGGIEGQPLPWLKLAIALGNDIHRTSSYPTAPGFQRNYSKLWSDTTITFLPTAQDSIAFKFTRNTQPAFSSPSVYDDTVYDLAGRHKFSSRWAVGAGVRLYNGDWFEPVKRNDWIYTVAASLAYTHNAHWGTELAYAYDWTQSEIPNTSGREYTRSLVWLSVKWSP